MFKQVYVASTLFAASMLPASAQAPVKIGMITTLTGSIAYLGEDARDAFKLAIEEESGKLGGVPVQLVLVDDGNKPGLAKQSAEQMMKADGVKLFTGILGSNVATAVVPDIVDGGGIYVSLNAGPSNLAGAECHKNYFVASWQNDNLHEATGQVANQRGFKKIAIIVANYQGGKDATTGFKRLYKGKVVGEFFTRLDQTDFAAELAQINALSPDAVFVFLPGGLGIAFGKQYSQSGLNKRIPLVVSAPNADTRQLEALGASSLGIISSSWWNNDFSNEANKGFVAAFEKRYGRAPTAYAAQGYDTARLIGSALKATKGSVDNIDAFSKALFAADFASVRGKFKFGRNHHPVQDWFVLEVVKDGDEIKNKTIARVMTDHVDVYAEKCKL